MFLLSAQSHHATHNRLRFWKTNKGGNFLSMKIFIKFYFIFLFSIASCHVPKNKTSYSDIFHQKTVDSSYYIDKLDIEDTKVLKDSFYMRFWFTYSALIDSGKIVNIFYRNEKWKAEFLSYRFMKFSDDPIPTLVSKIYKIGEPKSGWLAFIEKIKETGIFFIKQDISNEDLGVGLCNDANVLKIEFIGDRKTKFVFNCWEAIENKNEVSKVINSLLIIEKEFGFNISPLY